jgi:glutamine amidotransferase
MCRWIAYTGAPVPVAELLYGEEHSIVAQSLTSYEGAEPTNGDGFGVGWYADGATLPSRYRSTAPAWNDQNLDDVVGQLHSRMVLMHVRASSGSPVQLTNCHPFIHGRHLFVHNGVVEGFAKIRRSLLFELSEELFESVAGTTDSEMLFHLALGHGLADDPKGALERTVGQVEQACIDAGFEPALQLSIAVADGDELCGIRYASKGDPRTLYHSSDVETLKKMYPDVERLQRLERGTHMLVSEPLSPLPGAWSMVPPSSFIRFKDGVEHIEPFEVARAVAT